MKPAAGQPPLYHASSRTRRRFWLAVLVVSAVVAALIYALAPLLPSKTEPMYKGIPLSSWLARYDRGDPEARTAIQKIGTNAVPSLVKMLHAKDSWARRQVYTLADRLPWSGIYVSSAVQWQILALAGFDALGPTASASLPEVLPLLTDTNVCYAASWAAAAMGSDGIRALANMSLTNRSVAVRCAAISGLGRAQTDRDLVVATLARCIKDPHFAVRADAARGLGQQRQNPTVSLQALILATTDTNRVVRSAALEALGHFGSQAREAADVVRQATNDKDSLVQSAAVTALREIEK